MKDLVLFLLRFSIEEQKGGYSFAYQEGGCTAFESHTPYADGRARHVMVLKDEAVSGTLVSERPAVKQALELAAQGRVARVVVWRFDRLGRDEAETFVAIKEFESYGVEVLSATEANDRIVRGIQVVLSAEEQRKISARTRAALRQIAHENFPTGGPVPVGLIDEKVADPKGRRDKKGVLKLRTKYARDPKFAPIVEELFRLAGDARNDRAIAWLFNEKGYPSPGNRGRGWGTSTIRAIRTNEVYKGTLVHGRHRFVRKKNGKRVPVEAPRQEWIVIENCPNIEPLVSPEVWAKAQHTGHGGGGRGPNRKYALSGLVKCGECGGSMHASASCRKKNGKNYRYLRLRCGWGKDRGPAICPSERVFHYDGVMDAVVDILHQDLFSWENIDALVGMVVEELAYAVAARNSNRTEVEDELRKTEERLSKIVEAIELAQERLEILLERVKAHQTKIAALRSQLCEQPAAAEVPDADDVRRRVTGYVGKMADLLKSGNPAEVQAELKRHFREIRLFKDGRLRAEGTLEGLLQGASVVRNFSSGGGI